MEDSMQFCENCKREISKKKFELHITHCRRNIKFCDLCNEPISTNIFKAHLDEDHAVVPCSNCEVPLEKWMLPQHQESCERRLVRCEFCDAEFFLIEYKEHKDFCGSRTEKCILCQKYIMLKDREAHSLIHIYPKKIHKKKADVSLDVKQYSDTRFNSKANPYVSNKYNQKPDNSQDMREEATQLETIETSPEKSEAFMKRFGICHICKNYVAWVDMNVHIPTCASDAGKCSLCGENVLDEGIKEHMQKYCAKRSKTEKEPTKLLLKLSEDLGRLFESKVDTDCVLRVGNVQIPVHRALLSARSEVFAAMFRHDTSENRKGVVDIPDVDETVLSDVLYYIYSGQIRGLSANTAAPMFVVTDKYAVMELRNACLDHLSDNLTVENVCEAALLAHTHGETDLEKKVAAFMEERLEEIEESDKWKELRNNKPAFAIKLMRSVVTVCKEKLEIMISG